MGRVLAIREPPPLDEVVVEIRGHLYDAQGAKTKFDKHRLAAGQKLVDLRARIEAGEAGEGVDWWAWYETAEIGRSRNDAEKIMRMARSDDPERAAKDAAERNRQHQAKHQAKKRETKPPAYVSGDVSEGYDIVEHAMSLVAKMNEDEREDFDQTYREKYHV